MSTLGSTSEPTTYQEGYGLNSVNQMAQALTLPSGGPWRIYRLGGHLAGWNTATATVRLVLWSAGGSILAQGPTFTAGNGGVIQLGGSLNYEQNISDVIAAGGTTVYAGWWRHPSDNVQNGQTGSGTHIHDTAGSTSSALGGFSSHNGGIGSYLFYEPANSTPTAPTIKEPDEGDLTTDQPLIDWDFNDSDGDPQGEYRVQIDNNVLFGSINVESGWDVSATTSYTVPSGQKLALGTTYYLRVMTRDPSGATSPWSAVRSFRTADVPTVTVTSPGSDGVAAPLYYVAGSDTVPKLRIGWSFSCPDGGSQASASVRIRDAAGALLYTHAHSGSALVADVAGFTPVNGTVYNVSVVATCSHGLASVESPVSPFTTRSMRCRFGRASYRADLTAAPLTLSATASTTANSGSVILEYGSTTGTTPEPTDWKGTIAEVTKQRYIWHRVTLLPAATASPTSPTLNSLTLTYSNNVLTADKWTLDAAFGIDEGTYVYGTQSLKHTGDGTDNEAYQDVEVTPDTDYILSARLRLGGAAGMMARLVDPVTAEVLASVSAVADPGWVRYSTPVWNSGGATLVRVVIRGSGATGTQGWADAIKLEASTVVTPWTPGFLGKAVVLDAGGLSVDASAGGIFRLRGGGGTSRDVVELGTHGLTFGGDVELFSEVTDELVTSAMLTVESLVAQEADDRVTGNGGALGYPVGLSWFAITNSTDAGWPDADGRGLIVTFRATNTVIMQVWFKRGSVGTSKVSSRSYNQATDSWRPWITLGP